MALARTAPTFELLDSRALRPHYALTLEACVTRLEASWAAAAAAARDGTAAAVVLDWARRLKRRHRGVQRGS